jgi:hypothetical protein
MLSDVLKRSLILSIAFVISVGAILPFLALPTNAASINDASPVDEAKSTSYYRTLRTCINNEMNTSIQLTGSDNGVANPSKWFSDNNAYGYIFPEGKTDCKDIAPKALSLWGWGSDYSAFLRELGFTYNASNAKWTVANRDNLRNKFDSAVQAKYYGINFAGEPTQSSTARYEMFSNVFSKACNAQDLGAVSSISNSSYKTWLADSTPNQGTQVSEETANVSGTKDGSYVYFAKVDIVETVNGELRKVPHGYAYQASSAVTNTGWNGENATTNGDVRIYGYHNSAVERSCHDIQKGVTENVNASLAYAKLNPDTIITPPGNLDKTTPTTSGETASSCLIEGVGWIVCPMLTFMGGIVDGAYNFVSGLLVVQPLLTTGSTQGTYQAWVVMRNIANVAFVIAFLIIIFSQLTGVALSNYGVKKLLPRLVVAAILVNVSFWVCAIAIDLSNIIGASIVTVFDSVGANISSSLSDTIDDGDFRNGGQWSGIVAGIIAGGGGVALVAYYVGLSALIPALLAALVAIVTVFLVLTLRQALIILLIVVSPLAFVAYLLPNTEGYFTKWRKLFMTLLLMYPIIAGLFGASALASMVIMTGANGNIIIIIMGACVAILPLALTPLVMKTAGGVLNRFGGIVNNSERGPIDRLKKAGAGYRNTRNNLRDTRALSGQRQLGRGSFVKWRARKGVIDSGVKTQRGRVEQQYIADAMTKTVASADGTSSVEAPTSFANRVAGGGGLTATGSPIAADPAALQRALAGAKFTIEKAEIEDVRAEQSLISNLDMTSLKTALADPAASPARSAAVIDRMITIGKPADYMDAVNQYGDDKSDASATVRQTIASALRERGPQFLKASDLDNIATGSLTQPEKQPDGTTINVTRTMASMAQQNVKQGVYSEEKLVSESADNIRFAFAESNLDGKQRMVNTAASLKINPTLKGKIKHNAASIDNLSRAMAP